VGKILAIDWGRAVLGLAVSDELGIGAHALASLPRAGEFKDIQAIAAYVRELGIQAIVVGHPKNMDGSVGASAEAAQTFARLLGERFGLPVHLWDERLSTLAAHRALADAGKRGRARRRLVDQVAATIILQGFLDRQRITSEQGGP
jgi:putative Holliday junction resolvase